MLFLERGEAEGEERMVRKVFTMGDVLWVSSQRLMAERSYVCPSFATTGSLFEGVSGMKIVAREEGHRGRKAKGIYDQGTKLEGMAITHPHNLNALSPYISIAILAQPWWPYLRICAVMGH